MSLLHPSPGQVMDGLSILTLKVDAYLKEGRDVHDLAEQLLELRQYVDEVYHEAPPRTVNMIASLYTANSKIWECEDTVRSDVTYGQKLSAYENISRLNDFRADLMRRIDLAYGCEHPVEEKVYGCTTQK